MCPDDSPSTGPLLKLDHIDTYYGPIRILEDVNVEIHDGEMVCLLGGNASGKSTTLKTILGLVKPARGTIEFRGERIDGLPTGHIVTRGLAIVPENRRIFPQMTVLENLEMGAYLRRDKEVIQEDMERALALFPHLRERLSQLGGTLSGGEQQMLAIARALMSRPQLLLMDEPSMGLAPILVERIFELIQEINRQGTSIFMVEQNANMALSIADRGYVLQTGRIVLTDTAQNLLQNEMMKKAYLGT
jgi:branched-chain amino acid transport system ATP-binding protein